MPKTPYQSSEDRDLQAIKERRASSESDGTPQTSEEEEDATAPVELVERGEHQYEQELRIIQKEYERNPAYRALWNMIRRQRRESNRTLSKVADAALEAQPNAELSKQIAALVHWQNRVDTTLSIAKWLMGFVLAATLGSIIVIATKIYTWGVSSGELEMRLRHVERQVERRRFDLPNLPSAITPTK